MNANEIDKRVVDKIKVQAVRAAEHPRYADVELRVTTAVWVGMRALDLDILTEVGLVTL